MVGCALGTNFHLGPVCCRYANPFTTVLGRCHAFVLNNFFRQLTNFEYTGFYFYFKDTSHLIPGKICL